DGWGRVRNPAHRLPPRHAAAVAGGRGGRHARDVHSGGGRRHQRPAARLAAEPHDRQRDPVEVPRADGLPGRCGDVLHPDGDHPRARSALRARGGDGAADGMSAVAVQRAGRSRRSPLAVAWAFAKHHVLTVYSLLFFGYLMLPIASVILFSVNNPPGRVNYVWHGSTLSDSRYWAGAPASRAPGAPPLPD